MFFQGINYWPVAVAGVASMVLGFVWYSPILFGKIFMKEMGVTAEEIEEHKKKDGPSAMAKRYAPVFVLALLAAFVIAALLNSLIVTSISGYLVFAACVWLGFSLPVALNNMLFGKDTFKLLLINSGFQLANIAVATLIIGIWG